MKAGTRVLYRNANTGSALFEGVIGESAPSGKFIKLGDLWRRADQVDVVEELPPLTPAPVAEPASAVPPPLVPVVLVSDERHSIGFAPAPSGCLDFEAPSEKAPADPLAEPQN